MMLCFACESMLQQSRDQRNDVVVGSIRQLFLLLNFILSANFLYVQKIFLKKYKIWG